MKTILSILKVEVQWKDRRYKNRRIFSVIMSKPGVKVKWHHLPDGETVAVDDDPVAADDEGEEGEVFVLLLFNMDEAEFKLARMAARPAHARKAQHTHRGSTQMCRTSSSTTSMLAARGASSGVPPWQPVYYKKCSHGKRINTDVTWNDYWEIP